MKKGFTLIELLAVIIILAILMIIAVPNILNTLSAARQQAFLAQAQSIYKAAEQQYIIDSMGTTGGKACYDKTSLSLGSISNDVTFKVEMNTTNGTVSTIAVTDTAQKFTANGTTTIDSVALVTYSSTTLSCPSA